MNNSDCVCGTTEKALMQRFYRATAVEGHYGLPGMRERATVMGGKLVVWSEVDAGTEVELTRSCRAAYATVRQTFLVFTKFAGKEKA